MMTSEIKYRLDEYIIIEHGDVFLTWVSHTAIGAQLRGRCFIIGSILVIGPREKEEAGFLKLEFDEHLEKLPVWTKTTYYCLASSLRKVESGQSFTQGLRAHPYTLKLNIVATDIKGPETLRLGRYKIIIGENSIISWQSIGPLNRTISGKCDIESGILFLGQKEIQSNDVQNRREYFSSLKLLPRWDKTFAWGHYESLRICKEPKPRKSYAAIWKPGDVKISMDDNIPCIQRQALRKEKISQFKVTGSEWLKTAWHRFIEWNGWGRIKALIIAGIFCGLRIFLFILEELECLAHTVIARFRKHRDK